MGISAWTRWLSGGGGKSRRPRIIGPDAAGISPFYESGSFTPELRSSAGAVPGVNYGARSGAYTRIGSFVMFTLDMTINSISSPPASQAQITGFPIERAGVPAPYVPHVENIPVGGLGVPILDWVSATNLRLIHLNTNAGPSSIPVSSFGASARIKVAGVYQA